MQFLFLPNDRCSGCLQTILERIEVKLIFGRPALLLLRLDRPQTTLDFVEGTYCAEIRSELLLVGLIDIAVFGVQLGQLVLDHLGPGSTASNLLLLLKPISLLATNFAVGAEC